MERRDFIKLSAITGATAALDACGKPERQLIRFIPDEDLVPGVATWKPSICTLCPAGCGLTVRVMEADAEVVRHGQLGLMKMGVAKKLEGNPDHPLNRGKLCARGQAGLQLTYHPDRVRNPVKRTGSRGSGQFQEIGWDEALKELVAQLASLQSSKEAASLAFLTRPLRGQRREIVERFLAAFGAAPPVVFEFFDEAVARQANALSFGRAQLATLDLARSNYVISFGADFLGLWNSPVAQSRGYGTMRQGRPGERAKLVQAEPRVSLTGANADEWIAIRPGTEGLLALGLAHVIMGQKLRPPSAAGHAGALVAGWAEGLPDFTPEDVEKRTGAAASAVVRIARELAAQPPAIAVIGGAALAQTNGLESALAVNALNALLGSVGTPGGILFTPALPLPSSAPAAGKVSESVQALAARALSGQPQPVKALLLYDANPAFAAPPAWRVSEALEKIPFIASFGSFIDETSAFADLILPNHSPLESWLDDIPESGAAEAILSVSPPAMLPLHNTRLMPDVLLDAAHQLGGALEKALPWKTYDEVLRTAYAPLAKQSGSIKAADANDFWKKVQAQGGWWTSEMTTSEMKISSPSLIAAKTPPAQLSDPKFDGAENEFPFHFLPYASQQFRDGSLAHLPWLQEMPDPISSAMWCAWVEINSKTAENLGIKQGDLVEVASQHGKLQAPAVITPGIAPDVIAMPMGQGHENYTRYASKRGANPASILAPMVDAERGTLAWAATRVKITRAGEGRLILFGGGSQLPNEGSRR
jgi:anaerobic selenocysteine-containing dehydrogenase